MTDKRVEARKQAKARAINLATAHYETMIAGSMRGPIAVPEWDLDVYFKTTSTMAQEARVIELTQEGKTTEALVVQMITKALDEDGDHLFDMGDKLKLMNNVDPKVLLRVVTSMNEEVQEAETKSGN
mgnify:FL=1